MACIHAQSYTNVQSVLNTPKLIPYLNQGTQKIPAQISFPQKNPRIENFNLPDRLWLSQCPLTGHLLGICHVCSEKLQMPHVVLSLTNNNDRTIH